MPPILPSLYIKGPSTDAIAVQLAEHLVDEMCQKANIQVITLRPRALVGPGDTNIIPRYAGCSEINPSRYVHTPWKILITWCIRRILDRLKKRKLPMIDGYNNIVDMTYVDNVVDAMVLAAAALPRHSGNAIEFANGNRGMMLGKKYNITNGEPTKMIEVLKILCDGTNTPLPSRHISYNLAWYGAWIVEAVWRQENLYRQTADQITLL